MSSQNCKKYKNCYKPFLYKTIFHNIKKNTYDTIPDMNFKFLSQHFYLKKSSFQKDLFL